jgi:hypothetical protein
VTVGYGGTDPNPWASGPVPVVTQDPQGWAIDRPENFPGGEDMTDESQFQGYEVDPAEAGYEDAGYDDGGYYEDEYGAEGYVEDPYESLRDEYGGISEEKLAALAESMREVNNEQAARAEAIEARQIDQTAAELEREWPELRTPEGVESMLGAAAELLGFEGTRDELIDIVAEDPRIVVDAMEHKSGGEGQFLALWRSQQGAANQFWGAGGQGGGVA